MNIMLWILFGAIVGWLVSIVSNETKTSRIAVFAGLGIVGALIGGSVMEAFLGSGFSGINIFSLLVAIGSALLIPLFFHSGSIKKL